jgi:hypothetical protein
MFIRPSSEIAEIVKRPMIQQHLSIIVAAAGSMTKDLRRSRSLSTRELDSFSSLRSESSGCFLTTIMCSGALVSHPETDQARFEGTHIGELIGEGGKISVVGKDICISPPFRRFSGSVRDLASTAQAIVSFRHPPVQCKDCIRFRLS